MAQSKQFRYQHSAVSTPASTGIVSLYADLSGVLKTVNPAGTVSVVGQTLPNLLSGNTPGVLGGLAGYYVFNGPSGQRVAIPAYTLT